jgi:hypothetical protein
MRRRVVKRFLQAETELSEKGSQVFQKGDIMIQDILIPTDGSDYGKTTIAYGIYIARKLDAKLTGLHVVDIRLIRGLHRYLRLRRPPPVSGVPPGH